MWYKMGWVKDFMNGARMGRWSEEECLLGQTNNRSSIDPNDQGDLLGSSSDKKVPQKHTRKKETPKNI